MTGGSDAVVVGSGPNGLVAAVTLAQAGLSVVVYEAHDEIGGGTRTVELTVPGVLHDVCSASHPFAVASPALTALPLDAHGLEWHRPEVDLAHPLDSGHAAVLERSLPRTVTGLGPDGRRWRRVFGPLLDGFDDLAGDVLGPILRVPDHPVRVARFGLRAALSAAALARVFRTDEARALFAGSAAHIMRPLNRPASASVGVMLTTVAHHVGWPVAAGGSQAITRALAGLLRELGGTIETGVRVTSLDQIPSARVTIFDTAPAALADIAGGHLPPATRRAYRRWRPGPGAFKLDLAVERGIPWTAEPCRRAGVVHLGGPIEEITATEADVHRGRMPARPFVLVGQQYLCDPIRSAGDVHPVWTYAHVPRGYPGDATEAILDQIERFAPGSRERIVGRHVMTPADFHAYNANYAGGDILTGANDLRQLLLRPRPALDPYATGRRGLYLCSAATPPGAGVHGMGGHHAARRALAELDT
jgi:phytoene dehydrogenase-like protein